MKNGLAIAVLCVVALSLAAGESATDVADEIKNLERDWAQAISKSGATAADQYEADDILMTAAGGRVMDKVQHKTDLSSEDLKFESMELSNMTVHVYGDTAVRRRYQQLARDLQRAGHRRELSFYRYLGQAKWQMAGCCPGFNGWRVLMVPGEGER